VHVRRPDGSGYDYEENVFIPDGNPWHGGHRVLSLLMLSPDGTETLRETREHVDLDFDSLQDLGRMTAEGDLEAQEVMQDLAEQEYKRQTRIAAGIEHACAGCGCSESRACPGGCVWATRTLCSRCANPGRAVII
jgi:hypothetical protein